MRFGCDTGGTFTDLVVDDGERLRMFKAHTTPADPVDGVFAALRLAADDAGETLEQHLARGEYFIHGTTRAINALVTGSAARTALLCTAGHRDTLLFREGGRADAFDYSRPYPDPLVPRSLTFEVQERMSATGEVLEPLDEAALVATIEALRAADVEAVAVALLWSIVDPRHELRVAELLDEHLPGVPYTLSHRVNPTLREYRRTSSACIDASLKPLMTKYFDSLTGRLRDAGFGGRVLVVTSQGAMLDAADVAREPIHSLNSGPSMAPVAGRHFARRTNGAATAVIADTGGTTYDVSIVRDGVIPWTRETWLGEEYQGHITGFPSVAVRSIGAGGGSIAWLDEGGLLCVGPRSAGSVPGPACYGRGGTDPTVTDACLVLGYIDPDYFLGGAMRLDADAAAAAIEAHIAAPLGMTAHEAAAAIVAIATSNMVHAIEDVTVNEGIDPAGAVLVGGGGAAGLNSVQIARRLGCATVLFPEVGAALSAAGGLLSDLSTDFATTLVTSTDDFDFEAVNAALTQLQERCAAFAERVGGIPGDVELRLEGRYPSQAWEIEVPVARCRFETAADVEELRRAFHAAHERLFAIADPDAHVEIVAWRARARCRVRDNGLPRVGADVGAAEPAANRPVYLDGAGLVDARVVRFDEITGDLHGPAIVESPFTTIVVDAGAVAHRTDDGTLAITP
jgi:N-methylhydantoinase A